MGGICNTYGRDDKYKFLFGKYGCKIPLRIPKRIWKYNIRIDCRDSEWENMDWVH